ncbi:MAG: hypothetical protein ACRDQX_08840, partial [Pseudonocardiaceae bacterium]
MTQSCGASVTGISGTPTKLDCAKAGARTLLGDLDPCDPTLSLCGADVSGTTNVSDPEDEAGILVFPALAETLTRSGSSPNYSYSLAAPTDQSDEWDCTNSTFPVTYPPYQTYTYSSSATDGGIPLSAPAGHPDDVSGDNYIGYEAVPLSSDYRASDSSAALSSTSDIVDSVDWLDCPGSVPPGGGGGGGGGGFGGGGGSGGYYGLKDIAGQGSYLAGAITEAQYLLDQEPSTRNGLAVSKDIVVLSDGEINDPNSGKDGVDPGAPAGNTHWADTTPCEDAQSAATAAKAAGTTIYAVAYDSSGQCDSTLGAQELMQDIATPNAGGNTYFYTETGDLTGAFGDIGEQLIGNSTMIPECTQAPPNC